VGLTWSLKQYFAVGLADQPVELLEVGRAQGRLRFQGQLDGFCRTMVSEQAPSSSASPLVFGVGQDGERGPREPRRL